MNIHTVNYCLLLILITGTNIVVKLNRGLTIIRDGVVLVSALLKRCVVTRNLYTLNGHV